MVGCQFWGLKLTLTIALFFLPQIESVLHMILRELKKLYAHHAPQLKPRKRAKQEDETDPESIDPIEDMYNILEGSALIPFIVVNENIAVGTSLLGFCSA